MIPTGICKLSGRYSSIYDKIIDSSTIIQNYKNTNKTAHIITYQKLSSYANSIECDYKATNHMAIGENVVEYYHYWDKLPYLNIY